MNKPEIILAIENHYKITLNQKNKKYPLLDYKNKNTFELNDRMEIIGLNLSGNQIFDNSILENLTLLNHLSLENNEITDILFLKNLT
ncbi:hypothetical protein, partial [Flavobacterium sp. A45]|uniref:hypothetical protein n=1 Tax=Flavobacterium sp. A45 TaxID=1945862 RepID=UPI0009C8FD9E